MTNQTETLNVHPFERTLGPGPYKFVGVFDLGAAVSALQSGNVGGYQNAMAGAPRVERGMGTCAHCATAISLICIVRIADGRLFGVGSDCIAKVGLPVAELTKLDKLKRERAKAQRLARKASKGDAARDELKTLIDSGALVGFPHPTPFLANQGHTLLDYVKFVIDKSNDGGIVIVLGRVKAELSKGESK